MKYLITINGVARVGKDTTANFLLDGFSNLLSKDIDIEKHNLSSIDVSIKASEALQMIGINLDRHNKNDTQRNLYSELKMLFDRLYDASFKYITNIIDNSNDESMYIYHVREIENIDKLKKHYENSKEVKFFTIKVENPRIEHTPNNIGDLDAKKEYDYDFLVLNDSDLESLKIKTEKIIDNILKN